MHRVKKGLWPTDVLGQCFFNQLGTFVCSLILCKLHSDCKQKKMLHSFQFLRVFEINTFTWEQRCQLPMEAQFCTEMSVTARSRNRRNLYWRKSELVQNVAVVWTVTCSHTLASFACNWEHLNIDSLLLG